MPEPTDEELSAYLAKITAEQPEQSSEVGEDPEFQIAKSKNMEDLLDEHGKVKES